jgi:glycosyltransferase involved in cell wall biosynthesis
MNISTLVSIIIPVYNVEAYLHKCVNSIVNQTYKNLEIILVNDGSTDTCGAMCNEFAVLDDRIVVIHQENAGLAEARNVGTACATGDYIFYLDSDDYLDLECIEKLLKIAINTNATVVQANFFYSYSNHLLYFNKFENQVLCYSSDEAFNALIEQQEIKNFAWGKLIRSKTAKLFLFPKGKYFEDTVWMYQIVRASRKYVITGEALVYYNQRDSSISGSFSMRNLDQLEMNAERLKLIQKQESLKVYDRALYHFNALLLQQKSIIALRFLVGLNKPAYLAKIDSYILAFDLKKRFCFSHFISSSKVLSSIDTIYRKTKNKFFKKSYWTVIHKDLKSQAND